MITHCKPYFLSTGSAFGELVKVKNSQVGKVETQVI